MSAIRLTFFYVSYILLTTCRYEMRNHLVRGREKDSMAKQKKVELMDVARKFNLGMGHHLVLVRGGGMRVTARVGAVEIFDDEKNRTSIRFINVKQSTMTAVTGGKPSLANLPEIFDVLVADFNWVNRPEQIGGRFTGLKLKKKHSRPVQVANISGVLELRIS